MRFYGHRLSRYPEKWTQIKMKKKKIILLRIDPRGAQALQVPRIRIAPQMSNRRARASDLFHSLAVQ
jgi:hypothetical protein